jgi:hypothetical protein
MMTTEFIEYLCELREGAGLEPLSSPLPNYTTLPLSYDIEEAYHMAVGDGNQLHTQQEAFYAGALAVLRLLGDTWGKKYENIEALGRDLTHEVMYFTESQKGEHPK